MDPPLTLGFIKVLIILMRQVPEKNKNVVWQMVGDELMLLNPETGSFFGLNQVASECWDYIDGQKSIEDIVAILLKEYDVQPDTLSKDIYDLIQKMEEKGIITLK